MIREADRSDVPAILQMAERLCAQSDFQRGVVFNERQAQAMTDRLVPSSDDGVLLLAIRDQAPIGMLGVLRYPHLLSGEWLAAEVCWWVDPQARGTAGVALLTAAEQWATDHRAHALQMVAPTEAFGHLYARRGYQAHGTLYERTL